MKNILSIIQLIKIKKKKTIKNNDESIEFPLFQVLSRPQPGYFNHLTSKNSFNELIKPIEEIVEPIEEIIEPVEENKDQNLITSIETSFTVYDKNTHQYIPALNKTEDIFNDSVRIIVPTKSPMPGTGNRYFKRGTTV